MSHEIKHDDEERASPAVLYSAMDDDMLEGQHQHHTYVYRVQYIEKHLRFTSHCHICGHTHTHTNEMTKMIEMSIGCVTSSDCEMVSR